MEDNIKKKVNKEKVLLTAILIVGLLIMTISGIFVFAGEYIKNQWKLITLSPREYYIYVEKNNADKKIKSIVNTYSLTKNLSQNQENLRSYVLPDDVSFNTENILTDTLISDTGFVFTVDLEKELDGILGNIDLGKIELRLEKDRLDEYDIYQLSLHNNSSAIITMYLLKNIQNEIYLKIKEYSNKYIRIMSSVTDDIKDSLAQEDVHEGDVSNLADGLSNYSFGNLTDGLNNLTDGLGGLTDKLTAISDDELKKILERIFYYVIENTEEINLEKSVNIYNDGKSVKCNIITVRYTINDFIDILSGLLQQMSNDNKIYDIFIREGLVESRTQFKIYISSFRTIMNSITANYSEDAELVIQNYVNNKGEIIYRDIMLSAVMEQLAENTVFTFTMGYGSGFSFNAPKILLNGEYKDLLKLSFDRLHESNVVLDDYPSETNCMGLDELEQFVNILAIIKSLVGIKEAPDITSVPGNLSEITKVPVPTRVPLIPDDAPVFPAPEQEVKTLENDNDDFIILGKYKGLRLLKAAEDVTNEEVDSYISDYLKSYESLVKTNAPAKTGDTIIIDYSIYTEDGYNASGKNHELVLGEGFIEPQIENKLLSGEVNQIITGDCVLSKEHGSSAGKKALFWVEIKDIYDFMIPELTDSFVRENMGFNSAEEYKKSVKENLEAVRKEETEANLLERIISQIIKSSEIIRYPDEEINIYKEQLLLYYKEYAVYNNLTEAELATTAFGMTIDEFNSYISKTAEESVFYELVLNAIIEAEDFNVSEEQMESVLEEYASQYGYASVKALLKDYTREEIKQTYILDLTRNFLLTNTVLE